MKLALILSLASSMAFAETLCGAPSSSFPKPIVQLQCENIGSTFSLVVLDGKRHWIAFIGNKAMNKQPGYLIPDCNPIRFANLCGDDNAD